MEDEGLHLIFILFFLFMAIPFFYIEKIKPENNELVLNEETSRHIVQVLRMQAPDVIQLTDGNGNTYLAEIVKPDKKGALVKITSSGYSPPPGGNICIAISLLKNNSRFEWFLEKATELGINRIIPLICRRTEKDHFRSDRMNNILVSAMLQSQQSWKPVLDKPIKYKDALEETFPFRKYIAYCREHSLKKPLTLALKANQLDEQGLLTGKIILIGPEGDFTEEEEVLALEDNYIPVSLGETRLRAETAGIVAAVLLRFS